MKRLYAISAAAVLIAGMVLGTGCSNNGGNDKNQEKTVSESSDKSEVDKLEDDIFKSQDVYNKHMKKLYDELHQYQDKIMDMGEDSGNNEHPEKNAEWIGLVDKEVALNKKIEAYEKEAKEKGLRTYCTVSMEEEGKAILKDTDSMIKYLKGAVARAEEISNQPDIADDIKQDSQSRVQHYNEIINRLETMQKDANLTKEERDKQVEEIREYFRKEFGIKEKIKD